MQPITEPPARKRGLVDRMAIVLLVSVVAVSVGGVALLTVYLDRIGDAAAGLHRVEALGAYQGRPAPVMVNGVGAVNFLLMTTDGDASLQSVLIAHLSASHRNLTLIALPPDLLAPDGRGVSTLADSYRADPLLMARAVETVTGARMDHQVHLDADGFASVVDVLGGLDLPNGRMTGSQVVGYLGGTTEPLGRSERTAQLLQSALGRASMGTAIADPGRFDQVIKALIPCVTVDAGLTSDVIRETMMESRVQTNEIVTWPLAAATSPDGSVAVPASLGLLRAALAADSFPGAAKNAQQAPWPSSQPSR